MEFARRGLSRRRREDDARRPRRHGRRSRRGLNARMGAGQRRHGAAQRERGQGPGREARAPYTDHQGPNYGGRDEDGRAWQHRQRPARQPRRNWAKPDWTNWVCAGRGSWMDCRGFNERRVISAELGWEWSRVRRPAGGWLRCWRHTGRGGLARGTCDKRRRSRGAERAYRSPDRPWRSRKDHLP